MSRDILAALPASSWAPERLVTQSRYAEGLCENCPAPIEPGTRKRSRAWLSGPATADAHVECPAIEPASSPTEAEEPCTNPAG